MTKLLGSGDQIYIARKSEMANLHRARDLLICGYFFDMLDDDDFVLLYDMNKPSNPDFNYKEYSKFDLNDLNDDECNAYFR